MSRCVTSRIDMIAVVAGIMLMVIASPARPQQPDDPEASFAERFAMPGIAPVFTRPDVIVLLSALDGSPDETAASGPKPVGEGERSQSFAFAEPKGPAKILKDLLMTPIQELIVSRAEAGPEAPLPPRQENAETTAVPVRAAEPLAERPPADRVAAAPTALPAAPSQLEPDRQADARLTQAQAPAPAGTAAERVAEPRDADPDRSGRDMARPIGAGRAAWYQHPGRTASGERFDPNRLTAAHRSLPFGTWVRVINEANGRSTVVRVNDRVPRKTRILIDLSRAGAREIGLSGVGRVSLYRLDAATTASVTLAPIRAGRTVRPKSRPEPALTQMRTRPPSKIVAMQRP